MANLLRDELIRRWTNPVVIAAGICAVLIYSGTIKIRSDETFVSAANLIDTVSIQGKVWTNPSKTSQKYYCIKIDAEKSTAITGGTKINSQSKGKIKALIPATDVESILPGKLYSFSRQKNIIEKGARIKIDGFWSEESGFFICDSCSYLGFEDNVSGKIARFRAVSRIVFKRLMYSWGECGAFILSLLSGAREYTDEKITDSFRKAGLSHILALSGMHLSFFSNLAGKAGSTLLGKKYSFWAKLLGILFFIWFAGLSPSLYRAGLCSILVLFAGFFHCPTSDYFCILCGAFLIHCTTIPDDIFEAAFILSYGALAGILIAGDLINIALSKIFPDFISQSLSASISAQSATAPVSLKIFGEFYPAGIISSVIVSPLISLFFSCSIFSILICLFIPAFSSYFGKMLEIQYFIIIKIVSWFAKVPSFTLPDSI